MVFVVLEKSGVRWIDITLPLVYGYRLPKLSKFYVSGRNHTHKGVKRLVEVLTILPYVKLIETFWHPSALTRFWKQALWDC
jgi:hypothetical protein